MSEHDTGPWLLSDSELDEIADCVIADITEDPAPVWGSTERVIATIRHLRDINSNLLAAAEALVADVDSWETIYTNPNVPQTAAECVDISMAVVDRLRAAIAKARGIAAE